MKDMPLDILRDMGLITTRLCNILMRNYRGKVDSTKAEVTVRDILDNFTPEEIKDFRNMGSTT